MLFPESVKNSESVKNLGIVQKDCNPGYNNHICFDISNPGTYKLDLNRQKDYENTDNQIQVVTTSAANPIKIEGNSIYLTLSLA